MNNLFNIKCGSAIEYKDNYSVPYYSIFLFKGRGQFSVDFNSYDFEGLVILFLSPYQNFQWFADRCTNIQRLQFHGDFYCIEYHKQEVACNGLLFNNIYLTPHIKLPEETYGEILNILERMVKENTASNLYSEALLKTYLQLILALCSKEKNEQLSKVVSSKVLNIEILSFQDLIEEYFITNRSPAFYASRLAITPSALSKKIKKEFGKTPSQLIQERVVLEAKKMLHLTHKSVKEIAFELYFEDVFYFSRYFKKAVGLSPLHYRENVGISIVAE